MGDDDDSDDDDEPGSSPSRPITRSTKKVAAHKAPDWNQQAQKWLHAAVGGSWALDRWDMLLVLVSAAYVVICPFSKVEESFNLQVPGAAGP